MMALPFSGGSATGLSATDAWRRAALSVMVVNVPQRMEFRTVGASCAARLARPSAYVLRGARTIAYPRCSSSLGELGSVAEITVVIALCVLASSPREELV